MISQGFNPKENSFNGKNSAECTKTQTLVKNQCQNIFFFLLYLMKLDFWDKPV